MSKKRVLISGAGIAGPALAYWLARYGFAPTIVERASALREGGQAVDFRGAAHLEVLRSMGIYEAVASRQTRMGVQVLLGADGSPVTTLPAAFMSGDLEILRGDLSRILFDKAESGTEAIFGHSISRIVESDDDLDVTFDDGSVRTFDLVVGADGLHSNVRSLVFGEESRFVRFLGHYVASFTMPNAFDLEKSGVIYSVPGRGMSISSARKEGEVRVSFVFASSDSGLEKASFAKQKEVIVATYAGVGWRVPEVISALRDARDLYFDAIARVDISEVSKGRVALIGDAAFGATLAGQGTGAALIAAYVLAGELDGAKGDHALAFARYERLIRPYATRCQKNAVHVGPFYAPSSRAAVTMRNTMYRVLGWKLFEGVLHRLVTGAADGIALSSYGS